MRRAAKTLVSVLAPALLVCIAVGRPAWAQAQPPVAASPSSSAFLALRSKSLDALFESLSKATARAEAQEITAEIWRHWSQSGRSEIDALMQQSAVAMSTRNYGLASLLLDEVVEMAPDFSEGWNRRATLRFTMGDHVGSLDDIDKVLELEPRHFGALAGQGMIHMTAKRWRQALAAYRKALPYYRFNNDMLTLINDLEKQIADQKL